MQNKLLYKSITEKIIGIAMEVHKVLGCGFLEKVYEEALCLELEKCKLSYESQKNLDIVYKNKILKQKYYADIIVEEKVIIELKATSGFTEIDKAQIFNYLKATNISVGLLINFGKQSLEFKRIICDNYFNKK